VRWENQPGWVGGQLGFASVGDFEGGRFALVSRQTRAINLSWNFPFLMSKDASDPGQPLSSFSVSKLLHAGDHIAVELESRLTDGSWSVGRVILLNPCESASTLRLDPDWPLFLDEVRDFFKKRQFLEVQTPTLVTCPGLEPTLEPFAIELKNGTSTQQVFLPTSPEIHLKKALCAGFTDIFEIKTCFRNGEISAHHQPEFCMLEWYRAYADLEVIIADVKALLTKLRAPKLQETTFAELFREHLGVQLTPETSRAELWNWCKGLHPVESDSATDLFHRIWIDKIEPKLLAPTLVRDFPPEQAALARVKVDGWADRFEIYWNGLEIANAFHEINDPKEQRARWEKEAAERTRTGRTQVPIDEDLLARMKAQGLPPSGGIALGLERLFMAATRTENIRTIRLFPY
jgi:lysyl-tRNA synthetase class 2